MSYYHYTSVDGFKSIIEKKTLRFTQSEFLNDPDDCKVLYNLIDQALGERETYIKTKIDSFSHSSAISDCYDKAPLIDYIKYLQKSIPVYVLSLTSLKDKMEMWNYYGNGGILLEFDENELQNIIKELFESEHQYIACSKISYIPTKSKITTLDPIQSLNKFKVATKTSLDLFNDNKPYSPTTHKSIYDENTLSGFLKYFIDAYLESLNFLLKSNNLPADPVEIFQAVFKNAINLNNGLLWKKDLTIYMTLLSTLFKNDTYTYEQEFRAVYFEEDAPIKDSQNLPVQYDIKSVQGQKIIKPYIEFANLNLDSLLKSIVISPLTNNVSIDEETYKIILSNFIESNINAHIPVEFSNHKIRW